MSTTVDELLASARAEISLVRPERAAALLAGGAWWWTLARSPSGASSARSLAPW